MPRRPWLPTLGYLLFLIAFVEIALQAFYYFTAGDFLFARVGRPLYVPDEYAGFWNKPDLSMVHNTNEFRTTWYTNREGLRVSASHEEYAPGEHPEALRILLLGPSFAFGWGVNFEETFGERLRDLLQRGGYAGGRKIELINAGVPSLGAAADLNWYAHRGRQYEPDLVIQLIYGSMAVESKLNTEFEVNAAGYLVPKDETTARRLQATFKQSAIVFYGWLAYAKLRAAWQQEPPAEGVLGAGREIKLHGRFDPDSPEVKDSLEFYEALRSEVAASGARLLVVYLPLSYCVHPKDASRWSHLGVRNVAAQIAFDDAFCRYLDARGIRCLNVTPDLVEAAREKNERLYYWLDIHWTPQGNLVAATAVAGGLLDREHR